MMTPPLSQAPLPKDGEGVGALPAVSDSQPQRRVLPLVTLKKRSEFLACARARKTHAPSMLVQGRVRSNAEGGPRVGFTCSKKVGNSVVRNRAKRRLREAARAVLPHLGRDGWDYVLVGRSGATVARRFADLVCDLETALGKLHGATR